VKQLTVVIKTLKEHYIEDDGDGEAEVSSTRRRRASYPIPELGDN
jgi:hypothetical protein